MVKSLWTPDHHGHMWFFPKLLPQCWTPKIAWNIFFFSLNLRGWNFFPAWQYLCAQTELQEDMVCQDRSEKTQKFCTEPWAIFTKCLWDELRHWLHPRPPRPTSVPDLTNALVTEWTQVPAATLHNLVGSLPRRLEVTITAHQIWTHISVIIRCPYCIVLKCTWSPIDQFIAKSTVAAIIYYQESNSRRKSSPLPYLIETYGIYYENSQ